MSETCAQHHMVEKMATDIREIKICLLGDPTSSRAGGLRAEVDRHASVIAMLHRLMWIVIGSGVAAAAALVISR